MVADSITDSQLFRGSPIARDDFKKRKANWVRKLKQWKIDDARRSQWIHQCEEEDGCSRLRDKPPEMKTLGDRFSHLRAWRADDDSDDDDETGLSAATASGSPTSVLKNKDSDSNNDCFCCSKQLTEEEEASVDANDEEEEGPSQSDHNKSTSTAKPEEPSGDQKKKEDECCPLCAEKMDKTDLRFKPCSSCEYKVCLFCYKRINESTGVCPGCRKKYEQQQTGSNSGGEVTFQQRGGDPLPLSSSFQGLDSD
ncbi:hypothetical protein Bca4012_027888 [Brassica carinata]